ncbi:MAG TPA: hypothetical protein PLN54_11565 [Flavobacteriales bacterium]|nr:hypothetical protein [Flavobacteriales bacterium]
MSKKLIRMLRKASKIILATGLILASFYGLCNILNIGYYRVNKKFADIKECKDSTGLFISDDGLRYTYYKSGLRNGVFASYSPKTGRLSSFGQYKNGRLYGNWFYFDESNQIFMTEYNIVENDSATAINGNGKLMRPEYKSYCRLYWPNGLIRMEGMALYNISIEMDFFMYGEWLHYDSCESLVGRDVHVPGVLY